MLFGWSDGVQDAGTESLNIQALTIMLHGL